MNQERKPCPYCGESIAATAKKCRFCGEWIQQEPQQPQSPSPVVAPQAHQEVQPPRNEYQAQQEVQPPRNEYQAQQVVQPPRNEYTAESYPRQEEFIEDKSYFHKYIKEPYLKQFADFGGYTSRKDYWMAILFYNILSLGIIGLGLILMFGAGSYVGGIIVLGLYYLFTVIPSLSLTIRRLRDSGKSPLTILLSFIPFVGPLILLILMCQPSQYEYPEENIQLTSADYLFLGGCGVSLIIGICFLFASPFRGFYNGSYDDDFYSPHNEYYSPNNEWTQPTYQIDEPDYGVVEEVVAVEEVEVDSEVVAEPYYY